MPSPLTTYRNYSDVPYALRCRVYGCLTPNTGGGMLSRMNFCPTHTASEHAVCSDCNEPSYRPYMHYRPEESGLSRTDMVCETCYDRYPWCDYCDEIFHPSRGSRHQECGPGDKIHDDGYKPYTGFKFHGGKSLLGRLHMGFELEIPCRDNVGTVINDHFADNENSVYVKTDGSVYDGYEVCTMPRTLASYQDWDDNWKWLDKMVSQAGAHNPDDDGHGLHVHLSKTAFRTPQHMGRFYLFFKRRANREFIEHIAGRAGNDWASFYAMRDVTFADVVRNATTRPGYLGARYSVLNMNNPETIEFRLGCATVDRVKILGLLEFLAAVVEYTRKLEGEHEKSYGELLAWIRRGSRRRQTYSNFLIVAGGFEAQSTTVDSRELVGAGV